MDEAMHKVRLMILARKLEKGGNQEFMDAQSVQFLLVRLSKLEGELNSARMVIDHLTAKVNELEGGE